MARRLGNISRETIPLLILFVAQQKPSRGGLWHPILMQFYSGPLMQLLSGVDRRRRCDHRLCRAPPPRLRQRSPLRSKHRSVPIIRTWRRRVLSGETRHEASRRRYAGQRCPRSAAHGSDRDAAPRRTSRPDCSGPQAPRRRHDGILRQSRCQCAEADRPTLAGGAPMMDADKAYLALRRATGFEMANAECLLNSFAHFAAERKETRIRAQTAIDWAVQGPSLAQRDERLKTVRRFACHVRADDDSHELPPTNHFGYRKRRRVPYIYSASEISRLIAATDQLGPAGTLRSRTYAALLSLLAATGLP